ncbi:hypothetical protein HanIR_Chr07g0327731 [Helianthus annuus]|nr:hypothetical protein HanIR_Chr07g0327731 [Helianthus annuus]
MTRYPTRPFSTSAYHAKRIERKVKLNLLTALFSSAAAPTLAFPDGIGRTLESLMGYDTIANIPLV